MDRRDYFIGQALSGLCAFHGTNDRDTSDRDIARAAVVITDEVMALTREPPGTLPGEHVKKGEPGSSFKPFPSPGQAFCTVCKLPMSDPNHFAFDDGPPGCPGPGIKG